MPFPQCFFPDLDPQSITWIGREEGHRDITIWANEKAYVIENKLKSIPSVGQLNGYSGNLDNRFPEGLLTGLEPTQIVEEATETVKQTERLWKFKTYREISRSIFDVLKKSSNPVIENNKAVIAQYCHDIENMNDVVDIVLKENGDRLVNIWKEELEPLGLNDLANKINRSRFCRYFWNRVKRNELDENELDIDERQGFYQWEGLHTKQLTLDFRFATYDGEKPYFVVGVQIQGNQYRRCVEVGRTRVSFSADDLFQEFEENWFDKEFNARKRDKSRLILLPGMEGAVPTKLTHRYAKYSGNFVYQYYDLNESNAGYSQIYEAIISDLHRAKKIFEEKKETLGKVLLGKKQRNV